MSGCDNLFPTLHDYNEIKAHGAHLGIEPGLCTTKCDSKSGKCKNNGPGVKYFPSEDSYTKAIVTEYAHNEAHPTHRNDGSMLSA